MTERETQDDSALEFEPVPARSDVRISKKFKTPDDDHIRVIHTVGGDAILTRAGEEKGSLDSVTVTGDAETISQAKKSVWGRIWRKIKAAAGAVVDAVTGSGCKLGASGKLDKDGNLVRFSIWVECKT